MPHQRQMKDRIEIQFKYVFIYWRCSDCSRRQNKCRESIFLKKNANLNTRQINQLYSKSCVVAHLLATELSMLVVLREGSGLPTLTPFMLRTHLVKCQLQCRHLIPALNAWAAQVKYTPVCQIAIQFPGQLDAWITSQLKVALICTICG